MYPAPRGPEVLTRHPQVAIDATFTNEEAAGILEGLASWNAAVPEIVFIVSVQAHADVLKVGQTDTIYIIRNEGSHGPCPIPPKSEIGIENVGLEYSDAHRAAICLDATYVNANGALWKEITLHEVGHALGLDHMPAPSVMAIPYGNLAHEPQLADIAAVRALWDF